MGQTFWGHFSELLNFMTLPILVMIPSYYNTAYNISIVLGIVSNLQITYGTGHGKTRPYHKGYWGTLEFPIQRTWNLSLVNNRGTM